MDQRLRYEPLIGGKLQSLPVPDMADAIWARVEKQLDIDLPTDGGNDINPPQAPSGPGIIGWGLSIVVIALITIFLLTKRDQKINEPQIPLTTTTPKVEAPQNGTGPPNEKVVIGKENNQVPAAGITAPVSIQEDSFLNVPVTAVVPNFLDSVSTKPEQVVVVPAVKDSIPVKKKKGVSGLGDGDYRVVPKKDNR